MVRWGVVVLALLLVAPACASASEAKLDVRDAGGGPIGVFTYTADSGEANRVSVTPLPDAGVRVEDAGATIRPGENCMADGAAVVCRPPSPPRGGLGYSADLGDLDDETLTSMRGVLRGGAGNDTLISSGIVDGGPGGDTITGEHANLDYSARTAPVRATFDGLANDGEPGEGDDVRGAFVLLEGGSGDDVLESSVAARAFVLGNLGDDHLIGSAGPDELKGGPGDDVLEGKGGDDGLLAGEGADRSRGGPGKDFWVPDVELAVAFDPGPSGVTITPDDRPNDGLPGEGDDVGSDIEHFVGTPDDDHITGTDGPDGIVSGDGNDTILARGGDDFIAFHGTRGRMTIDPGAGRDTLADAADGDDRLLLRDGESDNARCEPATAPAIEADPEDHLADCASFLRFSKQFQRLTPSSRNAVALRARCVEVRASRCAGELRLYERGGTRVLARGLYDVPAGEKRGIRVRLTKTGRRLLARERRIPFVATASPTGQTLPPTAAHARGALVRRAG